MAPSQFQEKIVSLTDRDHILLRHGMYIGGVKPIDTTDFFLENDKFVYDTRQYIPGLIKIIFEPIDNSLDVAIKSNFEYANKIDVTIEDTRVVVSDNGYGISQDVDPVTGTSAVVLAVGNARAGSNFSTDKTRDHIGQYGVGVFLTNVYSKKFICTTSNGERVFTATFVNNAESYTQQSVKKRSKTGTTIEFFPDLEKFGVERIDEIHRNIIKQRLLILSVSYPEIEFKLNGEKIKAKNQKQFADMFGENSEIATFENGFIAYYPTVSDEFSHFTVINGQIAKKGGSHVKFINAKVIGFLREKLSRKYKDIKPSDIQNKLMLVAIFRKFPNPDYDGQTKEELTNGAADISKYLAEVDLTALGNRISKNKEMSELITEMYRIREEFQRKKDMEKLGKKNPKVKSDKYWPPVGNNELLFICEGNSARGGLMSELGRNGRGYFAIRGKLLNVLEAKSAKISANEEIDTLVKILDSGIHSMNLNTSGNYFRMTEISTGRIFLVHENDLLKNKFGKWVKISGLKRSEYLLEKIERSEIDPLKYYTQVEINQPFNSTYDYVVAATDQDADGIHIRALILTFFNTLLLPLLKAGRLKYLNTPLIALKRGDKIVEYFFSLDDYHKYIEEHPNVKGDWKYYKGLGSWADGELKSIIDKAGIGKFLATYEYDETTQEILTNWMSKETSDFRKDGIRSMQLDVSIA